MGKESEVMGRIGRADVLRSKFPLREWLKALRGGKDPEGIRFNPLVQLRDGRDEEEGRITYRMDKRRFWDEDGTPPELYGKTVIVCVGAKPRSVDLQPPLPLDYVVEHDAYVGLGRPSVLAVYQYDEQGKLCGAVCYLRHRDEIVRRVQEKHPYVRISRLARRTAVSSAHRKYNSPMGGRPKVAKGAQARHSAQEGERG